MAVAWSITHFSHTKFEHTEVGFHLQTYKTSDHATGAACVPDDTSRNKLLIAGIVLACVLLLALLLAVIMFWRWGHPAEGMHGLPQLWGVSRG